MSFPSIPNVLRILKYFLFYAFGKTVSLSALDFQAIFGVILKDLNANKGNMGKQRAHAWPRRCYGEYLSDSDF